MTDTQFTDFYLATQDHIRRVCFSMIHPAWDRIDVDTTVDQAVQNTYLYAWKLISNSEEVDIIRLKKLARLESLNAKKKAIADTTDKVYLDAIGAEEETVEDGGSRMDSFLYSIDTTLVDETDPRIRLIREAVGKLSHTLQETVQAVYVEGLELHEVAFRLSVPLGTIKWRMAEARRQITGYCTQFVQEVAA